MISAFQMSITRYKNIKIPIKIRSDGYTEYAHQVSNQSDNRKYYSLEITQRSNQVKN